LPIFFSNPLNYLSSGGGASSLGDRCSAFFSVGFPLNYKTTGIISAVWVGRAGLI
jgi:hypothetical protein